MDNEYTFELPTEYSRWHHLGAYNKDGKLIGYSDWIDPVHIHGLPLNEVYIEPMRNFLKYNRKLPYSYVQLGPTNSCNLSCKGCYSKRCRSKDTLDYYQVEYIIKKIASQVRQCDSKTAMISFHGPGEPMHLKETRATIIKAIEFCEENGLASRICTNATFDDDESLERLISNPSLKLIWISMKAGNEEAYIKYTGKNKYHQSRSNIIRIVELKEKYNRKDLTLKASTEISKYSIGITFDAALFCKNIGFDIFKPALHSIDFKEVYKNNKKDIIELRNNLKSIHDDYFNSLYWEIPKHYSDNYHADKFPAKMCFQVETRLYADGRGKLWPCIGWLDNQSTEYNFGHIDNFKLLRGNVKLTSFNKNNESSNLEVCGKCTDPWVNYFHNWLKYILEKDMNAYFIKIYDNEINDKYPQLGNENVLNNFDPRQRYYD